MSNDSQPDYADAVKALLDRFDPQPVMIDIGASGPPRQTWDLIAHRSTFVGFDADLREMRELTGTGFQRAVMIHEAVTAESGREEIEFYLTRSPFCSSTLEPDHEALADYAFADLFQVERKTRVRATTLPAVLSRLGLGRVDWFKTDSQGTDLRLFNSLPQTVREGVLCVEIEPGLIDVYRGEDLFVEAHRELLRQGFWLARAKVCGTARIGRRSMDRLRELRPELDVKSVTSQCPVSPAWVEGLYLRSPNQLRRRGAPASDYVLLWVFALMTGQWGFALDVALACESIHHADETSRAMAAPLVSWFTQPPAVPRVGLRRRVAAVLPAGVKQWIKRHVR